MRRTDLAIDKDFSKKYDVKKDTKEKEISVYSMEDKREKYIVIEFPKIEKIVDYNPLKEEIIKALKSFLPSGFDSVLTVALGNRDIISDSIGPFTANRLIATRHLNQEFKENLGLSELKNISVVTPDVLGKTGIEVFEMIKGILNDVKPSLVVAIDALATSSINRLFRTVQITNTGITPGSGVKNNRQELSEKTLGIPVISIGVPTVLTAESLAYELTEKEPVFDTDLVVTPKDCDLYTEKICKVLGESLNIAFQPDISPEIIAELS